MPEFITLADGSLAVKGRNLLKQSCPLKPGNWINNGVLLAIDNAVLYDGKPTLRTSLGGGIQYYPVPRTSTIHDPTEDVTFSGMDQNAVEQGVILWGAYTAGKTYAEMKDDDSDSHKFRLRSAGLVPLLGKASFTINIPSGICVIPYYFDSAGKSLGTVDSSWKTTTQSYTPPTGAVYAAIYFKKSDDSEIVPEDVLEVYIGGGG